MISLKKKKQQAKQRVPQKEAEYNLISLLTRSKQTKQLICFTL